jgi:hypothetical protein
VASVYAFHVGVCDLRFLLSTVENNKLFGNEQQNFLKKNYQNPKFRVEREGGGLVIQIFSTFEHTTYLELAINELEKGGVDKKITFLLSS